MERSVTLGRCYQVLGLPVTANLDQVRQAYRTLAVRYHPDENKAPDAKANFHAVSHAYHRIMSEVNGLESESESTFDAFALYKSVFGVPQGFGGQGFQQQSRNGFFAIDAEPNKMGLGNSFFFGDSLGEEEDEEEDAFELGFNPQGEFDDLDANDFEEGFEHGIEFVSDWATPFSNNGNGGIVNPSSNNAGTKLQTQQQQQREDAQRGGLFGRGLGTLGEGYFCPSVGLELGNSVEEEEEEEEEDELEDAELLGGQLHSEIGGFDSFNRGIEGFSLDELSLRGTWQPTAIPIHMTPRLRPSAPVCVSRRPSLLHLRWGFEAGSQADNARFFALEVAEHLPTPKNSNMHLATKAALDVLTEDDESRVDGDGFREIYRGDATEFVVRGLEPAKEYYFRVKAITNEGTSGEWSEVSAVSTTELPGSQTSSSPVESKNTPSLAPTPQPPSANPTPIPARESKLNPSSFPFQSRLQLQQPSPPRAAASSTPVAVVDPKSYQPHQQSPPLPAHYFVPGVGAPVGSLSYQSQLPTSGALQYPIGAVSQGSLQQQRQPAPGILPQPFAQPIQPRATQLPQQFQPQLTQRQSPLQHSPPQQALLLAPQVQPQQQSAQQQQAQQQQNAQQQRQRKWFKVTFTPIMNGLTSELLLKIGKVMGDAVDAEVEYLPGTNVQTGRGHIWFLGVPKDLVGLGFIPVKGARWSIRWPVRSTCSACRHRGHRARECPFKATIAANKESSTAAAAAVAAAANVATVIASSSSPPTPQHSASGADEKPKEVKEVPSQTVPKQQGKTAGQVAKSNSGNQQQPGKNGSIPAKTEVGGEISSTPINVPTPTAAPPVSGISTSVSPEDGGKNKSALSSRRSRHRRGRGGNTSESNSPPENAEVQDQHPIRPNRSSEALLPTPSTMQQQATSPPGAVGSNPTPISVPSAAGSNSTGKGNDAQKQGSNPPSTATPNATATTAAASGPSVRSRSRAQSRVVHVWGLPWSSSEEDIANFFSGLAIDTSDGDGSTSEVPGTKAVWIERRADGKSTGHGYIRFHDAAEADRALERHREFITPERYVCVEKSSEEALAAARRRSDQSTAKLRQNNANASNNSSVSESDPASTPTGNDSTGTTPPVTNAQPAQALNVPLTFSSVVASQPGTAHPQLTPTATIPRPAPTTTQAQRDKTSAPATTTPGAPGAPGAPDVTANNNTNNAKKNDAQRHRRGGKK